jgi:hypothetical protein
LEILIKNLIIKILMAPEIPVYDAHSFAICRRNATDRAVGVRCFGG